jgi:hypothetical protein
MDGLDEAIKVLILVAIGALLALNVVMWRYMRAQPRPSSPEDCERLSRSHQNHVMQTAHRFQEHRVMMDHLRKRLDAVATQQAAAPDAEDVAAIQNTLRDLQANTSEMQSQIAVVDERTKALVAGVATIQQHLLDREQP